VLFAENPPRAGFFMPAAILDTRKRTGASHAFHYHQDINRGATMTINEDIQLEGQQAIPTHPADPAAKGQADKVVGEQSPQTPDYNAPPPEGAIKSTGPAADPGVGGALGQPPQAARTGDEVPGAAGDADMTENQGGGDQISAEMQPGYRKDIP
jgi:hypothetical protein